MYLINADTFELERFDDKARISPIRDSFSYVGQRQGHFCERESLQAPKSTQLWSLEDAKDVRTYMPLLDGEGSKANNCATPRGDHKGQQ
jgi:hypothetical protein